MSRPRIVILGLIIVLLGVVLFTKLGVNKDNAESKVYVVPIAKSDIPKHLEALDNAMRLSVPTPVVPLTNPTTENTEAEINKREQ